MMLNRLQELGENKNNINAYQVMLHEFQNVFELLNSKQKILTYLKRNDFYFEPETIIIDVQPSKDVNAPKQVSLEFIPLRQTFKKFFEMSNVYEETMKNLENFET